MLVGSYCTAALYHTGTSLFLARLYTCITDSSETSSLAWLMGHCLLSLTSDMWLMKEVHHGNCRIILKFLIVGTRIQDFVTSVIFSAKQVKYF